LSRDVTHPLPTAAIRYTAIVEDGHNLEIQAKIVHTGRPDQRDFIVHNQRLRMKP
jgi:hypothetical protein